MRVGIQTGGRIIRYGEEEQGYKRLKDCGFECVNIDFGFSDAGEISRGTPSQTTIDFYEKSITDLKDFFQKSKNSAKENGLVFSLAHGIFPMFCDIPDKQELNDFLFSTLVKQLQLCQFLECPYIVVHPVTSTTINKEQLFELNMNLYKKLIPHIKETGVMVLLENMFVTRKERIEEGTCSTGLDAVKYVDSLNEFAKEECFGFCYDIGHATLLNRKHKDFVMTLGKRLKSMHLHDNDGRLDLHGMPFAFSIDWGRGHVTDWDGFICGLKNIDYRGDIIFENYCCLNNFPASVHDEMFKLTSAIGRHIVSELNK